MTQFIEKTGRTEAEAIEKALQELKLERDDVSIEVLDRPKKGFIGFGSKPAKVRVSYEIPEPEKIPESTTEKSEVPDKSVPTPTVTTTIQEPEIQELNDNKESQVLVEAKEAKESKVQQEKSFEATVPIPEKEADPAPLQSQVQEKPEETITPSVEVVEIVEMLETLEKLEEKAEEKIQETSISNNPPKEKSEKPVKNKKEPRIKDKLTQDDETQITEEIVYFLTGLMEHLHVEATPSISFDKDTVHVKMEGENLAALIGKRGETLDAIQQITGYVVTKTCKKRVRLFLDAENYREKREETLIKLANKVAKEVVKNKRNVALEPMNAYERHIIHEALTSNKEVYTYSTGSDPNRSTVIALQGKKYQGARQKKLNKNPENKEK